MSSLPVDAIAAEGTTRDGAAGDTTLGLLLAAGSGSRFDPTAATSKLLAMIDGRPTVWHAAAALSGPVDHRLAVLRPGAHCARIEAVLKELGYDVTVCPDAGLGMGHSLAWGAREGERRFSPARVVVALGDMPFVRPATISALIAAAQGQGSIAAPWFEGRRGHPVVFGRLHFADLQKASGDRGAASLLARAAVLRVDTDDAGVLRDIDTPADLPGGLTSPENNA